jgi:hypothetical protein
MSASAQRSRAATNIESASSERAWQKRLAGDRSWVTETLAPHIRQTVGLVLKRAREQGALSFALTGSTARQARALNSDLDFYVVGTRPYVRDIAEEIDVCALSPVRLRERLHAGDDYVHWVIRYGRILWDSGPLRETASEIAAHNLWPDPERKLVQAQKALKLAGEILNSSDIEAAQEQARLAFTALGRWELLRSHVLPQSRNEIPLQLRRLGLEELAASLEATISQNLGPDRLQRSLDTATRTLDTRSPVY